MPTSEPSRRDRLIRAALELLDEDGPDAVTTRTIAARAGTTTMAVYTEFGSLPSLVRAVVGAGFDELGRAFEEVETTDDPIADLLVLGLVYRRRALEQPALYSVMFGLAPLGGYRRVGDELTQGIETFHVGVDIVARSIAAGRIQGGDAFPVAAQLWSALHGQLVLEMSGILGEVVDPVPTVLVPLVEAVVVGLGDERERVRASIAAATARVPIAGV